MAPEFHSVDYLVWEKGDKPHKADIEKATIELIGIAEDENYIDINSIFCLWQEVGPLYPGNEIPLNRVFADALFGLFFLALHWEIEPVVKHTSRLVEELKEKSLENPDIKKWSWVYVNSLNSVYLAPATKNSWPIFTAPNEWPIYRKEQVEYSKKQVASNLLILFEKIAFKPRFTRDGIEISPGSLFEAIIIWNCYKNPESIKKKRQVSTKEAVANRFKNYIYENRKALGWGRLTRDEYKFIRKAIFKAAEDGVQQKEGLEDIGFNAMDKICSRRKNK